MNNADAASQAGGFLQVKLCRAASSEPVSSPGRSFKMIGKPAAPFFWLEKVPSRVKTAEKPAPVVP
jgi:hypothetical protein